MGSRPGLASRRVGGINALRQQLTRKEAGTVRDRDVCEREKAEKMPSLSDFRLDTHSRSPVGCPHGSQTYTLRQPKSCTLSKYVCSSVAPACYARSGSIVMINMFVSCLPALAMQGIAVSKALGCKQVFFLCLAAQDRYE
jgi:hypothetical protein